MSHFSRKQIFQKNVFQFNEFQQIHFSIFHWGNAEKIALKKISIIFFEGLRFFKIRNF